MKYLVDANALIWSQDDPEKLGASAKEVLTDFSNELLVGKGTLWEIAIKVSTGKLQLSKPLRDWIDVAVQDLKLLVVEIDLRHILQVADLPFAAKHRDPFDRILAVQSIGSNMPVVSSDSIFDAYGVIRIWD